VENQFLRIYCSMRRGIIRVDEMKQAATYLLANQIIFYHVLSKMDLAFEDIDEDRIGKPNDLLKYFNPVLEKDYSSIFGFDVASRLPDSSTKIIKKVIMAVKALAPEKIGHDVLGKVFHELIPFNIRKSVAAFYTNNEAAEILAQLSIDDPDAKVMDLAVGSGTLLVAAYRRKRELKKKLGTYDLSKDHKKFLEEDLTGIDIMPFAAHLAVMHLSLQALLSETEKVRIAVWDSTELKPGMNIPAIHKELKEAYKRPTLDMFKEGGVTFQRDAFVKKGAITLEGLGGDEIPLKNADLVIMNPPFTREERMPQTYKNSLMKRFRDYSDYLRRDLSFYSYFILLADKFLKKGGKIAFVMPATFLRVSANEGIRRFLLENYVIEHIVTTTERAAFSEQAQFREILLIARKDKGDGKEVTKFSILKKLPSTLKMGKDFARSIKKGEDMDNISTFTVTREELEKHISNWFEFIASDPLITNTWIKIRKKCEKSCNTFNKYLTNVNGQFKLGFQLSLGKDDMTELILMARDRAIKTKDVWILDKITRKKVYFHHKFLKVNLTCPTSCTKPTLRRAAKVNSMDITDKLDCVIVKKWKGYNKFKEYNTKSSNFSRAQTEVIDRLGNLAIVYRMDISASGTCALAFYSEELFTPVKICWICKIDQDHAKILTLWFNSTINIIQSLIRRVETRGAFLQLQKYALMNFLVLDPNLLSDREKTFLIDLFETIKDAPLPSIIDQLKNRSEFRLKMDKTLLEILGFDEKEIAEFVNIIYPAVINQIEQLKTLMAG